MERQDAAEIQARIVRYLAAFLAVVGLGIVYLAHDVLVLVADPKFWPAARLLPPLVLAGGLQVLTYPLQTGFLYRKATRHVAQIGLVQALFTTGGGLLMIKIFGLAGACATALLAAVVTMVLTHRISQRYFQVPYEARRLGWLGGLTLAFWAAGQPLALLPVGAAVASKLVLLCVFVAALTVSPAFEADEVARGRVFLRARWAALRASRAA